VRRGFAYPTALMVVILLSVLALGMVRRYAELRRIEHEWLMLAQAELNCRSAVNHFSIRQRGFLHDRAEQNLSFEEGNGFRYTGLPFGGGFLLDIEGFAGNQRLRTRQIIGSTAVDPHVLQLARGTGLRVEADAVIDGEVLLGNAGTAGSGRGGLDSYRLGTPRTIEPEGLAGFLAAQYLPEWRQGLETVFPDLVWIEGREEVDLSTVPADAPLVVVSGSALRLRGSSDGRVPILIRVTDELLADEPITLENVWIVSRNRIRFARGLTGRRVHLLGRTVDLAGSLDLVETTAVAIAWSDEERPDSAIQLSGRGRFEGGMMAFAVDEPFARGLGWSRLGGAAIAVSTDVDTAGFVLSEGVLSLRGTHRGTLVGEGWNYQQGDASFPGRLHDVDLGPGGPTVFPWGLRDADARPLFHWRTHALEPPEEVADEEAL